MGARGAGGRLFSILSFHHPHRRVAPRACRLLRQKIAGQRHLHHPRSAASGHAGIRADAAVLPVHAMARALSRELSAGRGLHAAHRAHRAVEIAAYELPIRGHHVRHVRDRVRRHHAQGSAGSGIRPLTSISMEALALLLHGFAVLMTWKTLALMMVGLVLGIFVGVLPGLGGPNGVAILLPLTFTMDPTSAIVMLSCIYWGALFGGAITSILFNIPGEAWSVATTFDGYPMAQQGKAAEALTAAFTSSFIGSLVAVLLITFLAPGIASFALRFGPPEFFAVYLLTFCSFVGLGREEKHKTIISMALGLLLAGVGMDTVSGQLRMTFGLDELLRGINFLVAVIGLFGISEILLTMEERLALRGHAASISLRTVLKVWKEMPRYWVTLLRSSAIGCWLGITPGGAIAASFMSYNLAKRFSKDKESFGKGRIEGVFAPETAAHASGTSALLPMLALGIPGSGTAAILLGGLMVWGLNPGPLLFVEHKGFVWGLIASMYLGNVVGLVLVLTTVPLFAAILRVPFSAIAPMIVVSCAIGAYAIQNAMFDIWLMLLFGVVGYVFKKIGIPLAPFTLALVLGNRSEDAFRLSMIGAGGDLRVFWSNGLVGTITTLAFILLFWPLIGRIFEGAGRLLRPVKT